MKGKCELCKEESNDLRRLDDILCCEFCIEQARKIECDDIKSDSEVE